MISLRVWLLTVLLALPFYTYSLNYRPRKAPEDVFDKRDLDEVREDLERRQQVETDSEVLASVSSVLESVSDFIKSVTEDPAAFTGDIGDVEASLSSVLLSLSNEVFITDAPSPTLTGGDTETTGASGYTSGSADSVTPGQVITDGTRTGTVGDDGTTRFCSASSYLCPASLSYGCCRDNYACGLTACTPSGGNTQSTDAPGTCSPGAYLCPSSVGYGCCPTGYICGTSACTPSGGGVASETQSKTTFSFDPITNTGKGNAPTGSATSVSDSGSSGLSGGAIGGIVGGVVGGVALIAAGIVWFCLAARKKPKTTPLPNEVTPGPGPAPPSENYTGGPLPPQPHMSQYGSPVSPPPQEGGYYQPYSQQYPGQQGPPTQGGYPQYGQNVSELGGAAMPYGQKGVEQPPQGISEAPANPAPTSPGASPHDQQIQQQPGAYAGHKGPSGPVYELS